MLEEIGDRWSHATNGTTDQPAARFGPPKRARGAGEAGAVAEGVVAWNGPPGMVGNSIQLRSPFTREW